MAECHGKKTVAFSKIWLANGDVPAEMEKEINSFLEGAEMTKEQRSIASAYVISALVGGVYLISWLTHVWGGQPWPINSNMVNYAVVLVLFGVSLLLFGNLFARILPQERGIVPSLRRASAGPRRGSGPCGICAGDSRLPYLLREHWCIQGVCGAYSGAVIPDDTAAGAAVLPAYGALFCCSSLSAADG